MGAYAIIENGIVINMAEWDGNVETWQPPEGQIAILMPQGINISIGWGYDGSNFIAPPPPVIPDYELAKTARQSRDYLLGSIYDRGILMAQRALRMASTPEQIAYAESKVSDLDAYAEALLAIPDQPGFPQSITWPIAPTK